MIPEFPNFKKLELSDRVDIEKFTSKYPPYSDFNFVSMWSWNVTGKIKLSQLSGNLVVCFSDYITDKIFFSFIGSFYITETARKLFEYTKKYGSLSVLKLVPENVANRLQDKPFTSHEDPDNFDYIYLLEDLCYYKGRENRGKKNLVNRFDKKYSVKVEEISLKTEYCRANISKIFETWVVDKGLSEKDTLRERKAIYRVFDISDLNIICLLFFIEKVPTGFIIVEALPQEYAVIHFLKAIGIYIGLEPKMLQLCSQMMSQKGCKFFNYEQDLGIVGLRKHKKDLHPISYLKKFIINYYEEK